MTSWFWGGKTAEEQQPAPSQESDPDMDDIEEVSDGDDDDLVCIVQMTDERRELQEQQQKVQTLKNEVQTLQGRLQSADRLHKKEVDFKDRQIEQKEVKTREYEKQIASLRSDKASADSATSRVKSTLAMKEKQMVQQDQRILALESDLNTTKANREALQEQSSKLAQRLQGIMTDLTDTKTQLTNKESQLHTLQAHVKSQEAALKGEQQARSVAEGRVADLSVECTSLRQEKINMQGQLNETETKHSSDMTRLQQLFADGSAEATKNHQTEILQLRADIERLKGKESEAKRAIAGLQSQIAGLTSRLETTDKTKASLEMQLKDSKLQTEMLLKEVKQLKETVATQSQKIEAQRNDFTNTVTKHQKERDETEGIARQLKKKIFELEKEHSRLQGELTSETEKRKYCEAEMSSLSEELANVKDSRIKELTEEKTLMTQQLSLKEEEIESLRAEIGFMKSVMADDQPQKEIQRLRDQLSVKERQISQMHSSVEEMTSKLPSAVGQEKTSTAAASSSSALENRVTVRCTKAKSCLTGPTLEKKKYAVPSEMNLEKFRIFIKNKLILPAGSEFNITVDGLPLTPDMHTMKMAEIKAICKKEDDCVHMEYTV